MLQEIPPLVSVILIAAARKTIGTRQEAARPSGSFPEWEGEMKNRGAEGRRVEEWEM